MTDVDDLRYPIGRFKAPSAITPQDRSANIAVLRELPARLTSAVNGLNDAQLDTPYRDGGWTVRQVVHHIADSHSPSTTPPSNPTTKARGQRSRITACPSRFRWR